MVAGRPDHRVPHLQRRWPTQPKSGMGHPRNRGFMADDRPWMIMAGGGTGGHLYPGLAVAESIHGIRPDIEITFFGTPRPIDAKLVAPRGYELVEQVVRPIPGRVHQTFAFLWYWYRAMTDAMQRFRRRPPAVVLGLGGYAAGPAVVAASKLRLPTAILNPDAEPGRANQRLAPRADRIFTQWHETAPYFDNEAKVHCTGCPVRSEFVRMDKAEAGRKLKLDEAKKTLLITGASQGAWTINAAVVEMMDFWKAADDWQIIHLTGSRDRDMCRRKYEAAGVDAVVLAFTEQIHLCMAAADLVISRAGASTLAEITRMGLPSVLMPYPYDRKQHQMANARMLADHNAAAIVVDTKDPETNAADLRHVLEDVMIADRRCVQMAEVAAAMGRHDAADTVAESLLKLGRLV